MGGKIPEIFERLAEALDKADERFMNEESDFNTYYEWVNELEEMFLNEEMKVK